MATTIDDLLASLRPSADEERQRQAAAMLGMFGNLIGSRRGQVMPALRNGMFQGFDMYNQMGEAQNRSRMDALRARSAAAETLMKENAFNDEQAMREARQQSTIAGLPEMGPPTQEGRMQSAVPPSFDWEGFQGRVAGINPQMALAIDPKVQELGVRRVLAQAAVGGQGAPAGRPTGMPTEGAAPTGPLWESPGLSRKRQQAKQYSAMADALARAGYPEAAAKYGDKAAQMEPKFKEDKPYVLDGKRVIIRTTEDGESAVMPFQPEPEKLSFHNAGSEIVGLDPITGKPVSSAPTSMTPEQRASLGDKQITQVHTIRKELNGLPDVQGYRAALPMLESAKRAPDTRAGDLDVIYAVGKALDPGSVVREGEMNLVVKSGSLPQQIEGMVNYVMGGGKLAPAQRAELITMLQGRVAQLRIAHDAASAPFIKQAQAAGLPLDQIVTPFGDPLPPGVSLGTGADGKPAVGNFSGTLEERRALEQKTQADMGTSKLTPAEQKELEMLRKKHGR